MIISDFVKDSGPANNLYPAVEERVDGKVLLQSWNSVTPRGFKARVGESSPGTVLDITVDDSGEIISLIGNEPLALTFINPNNSGAEKETIVLSSDGDAIYLPGGINITFETPNGAGYVCEYPGEDPGTVISVPLIEHASPLALKLQPGESVTTYQVGEENRYRISPNPTELYSATDSIFLEVLPDKDADVAQLIAGSPMTVSYVSGSGRAFVYTPTKEELELAGIPTDSFSETDFDTLRITEFEYGVVEEVKPGEIYCYQSDAQGLVIGDVCVGFVPEHEVSREGFSLAVNLPPLA